MSAITSRRCTHFSRRARTASLLVLGLGLCAGRPARAQPAGERPLPAKPAAEKAALADPPLPPEPAPASAGPPPAPPPAWPRPDEQEPLPYTRSPDPERPLRNVDIGPDFGIAARPARGDAVSYGAGFALGGHARIDITSWLGFRAYFANSDHPVSIPRGALGISGSDLHQPDLELVSIGGRFEPTWVVSPRLRLWAGAGAALAYFAAPAATSTGSVQVRSARRTGAAVDIGGALGGTFELIPDWLTAALAASAAVTTGHTGDVFMRAQAYDTLGNRHYTTGLPEFAGSFAATASLGLLL